MVSLTSLPKFDLSTRGLSIKPVQFGLSQKNVAVHTYHSFARGNRGGNPAGAVMNADHLTDQQMQSIATTVGYPETAFIQGSNTADFKVQFFTPNQEIDLCGTATLASFSELFRQGKVRPGAYTMEVKASSKPVPVTVKSDGTILMNQLLPEFSTIVSKQEVADCLGLSPSVIEGKPPCQVVSTGIKDLHILVKDLATLQSIQPNAQKITALSKKYGVIGLHVASLETKHSSTIASVRNFAPLVDIPEESATGVSAGALACRLQEAFQLFNGMNETLDLNFEQGDNMGQPSEMKVQLTIQEKRITGVQVGGKALYKGENTVSTPDDTSSID